MAIQAHKLIKGKELVNQTERCPELEEEILRNPKLLELVAQAVTDTEAGQTFTPWLWTNHHKRVGPDVPPLVKFPGEDS